MQHIPDRLIHVAQVQSQGMKIIVPQEGIVGEIDTKRQYCGDKKRAANNFR
jgi:hypothetical protein